VLGGTYTRELYDRDFFSAFQSVFINHFETKRPDPLRRGPRHGHRRRALRAVGGSSRTRSSEAASVEDVELSPPSPRRVRDRHQSDLQVRHVFRFARTVASQRREEARYWTM
jgi:hypothetical protein